MTGNQHAPWGKTRILGTSRRGHYNPGPRNTYITRVPGKLVTASKPDQETDTAVHKSCEPTYTRPYTRAWLPSQRGPHVSSFELLPPARTPGENASNPDFSGKESTCNAGDASLIPRLGEGNGYSFQYSCLGNSMETGPWLQSMGSQRVRHD